MAIPNDVFSLNAFPFTDFNKINLDWICDCLKAMVGGETGYILAKVSDTDFDFEWIPNSGGGGGTSNYNDLTNKPQINSVTLQGNKTLNQLGITAVALGAYVKPGSGIPKSDLASAVQTSLGKADTAIQAPASPNNGDYLTWNGSAWVASALPVYNGGVG